MAARFLTFGVLLTLALIWNGCRRNPPQPVDEGGRVIVRDKTSEEKSAEGLYRQMMEEMKSFDRSVDEWMTDSEIHPQNQPIDVAQLQEYLKGRLKEAVKDGKLMDPAGNPYVILTLSPDSNVRITVNSATAEKFGFKDFNWGEYAPR